MKLFGIDLGNESTKISILNDGKIETFINTNSNRKTKTLISFKNIREYGDNVENKIGINYKNIVSNFINNISNPDDFYFYNNFNNKENKEFNIFFNNEYYTFKSYEILTMFCTYLLDELSSNGKFPQHVTFGIKSNYSYSDITIFNRCLNSIDLTDYYLLHNNIAIALDYGFYRSGNNEFKENIKNIIFIDFGETYTEVSLVEFKQWSLNLRNSMIINEISGFNLKNELFNEIKNEFFKQFNIELDITTPELTKASVKIKKEINKYLKLLSANKETIFRIESIYQEKDLIFTLERKIIDILLEKNINILDESITKLCSHIGLTTDNIHSIEIVGGISRIPFIHNHLDNKYTNISRTLDVDDVISRGATLYSCIKSPLISMKEYKIEKEITDNIYLVCNSNKPSVLFKKGDKIPKTKKITIKIKDEILLKSYSNNNDLYDKQFTVSMNACKNIVDYEEDKLREIFVIIECDIINGIILKNAYFQHEILEITEDPKSTVSISEKKNETISEKNDIENNTKINNDDSEKNDIENNTKINNDDSEKNDVENNTKINNDDSEKKSENLDLNVEKPTEEVTPNSKSVKKTYQKYNLDFTQIGENYNIDLTNYLDFDKKIRCIEESIKNRDILVNNFETIIYKCRDDNDSGKFNNYLKVEKINECTQNIDNDLIFIYDGFIDDVGYDEINKRYKYYLEFYNLYKKNFQEEINYLNNIDWVYKKIDFYKNYFNEANIDLIDQFQINILNNKYQDIFLNLDIEHKTLLSIKPIERNYISRDKLESIVNEITDLYKPVIDEYSAKLKKIKEDEESKKKEVEELKKKREEELKKKEENNEILDENVTSDKTMNSENKQNYEIPASSSSI